MSTDAPGPIEPQQIDHLFGVPVADWHAIWVMARNRNMEPLQMAREWDATIATLTAQRDALVNVIEDGLKYGMVDTRFRDALKAMIPDVDCGCCDAANRARAALALGGGE